MTQWPFIQKSIGYLTQLSLGLSILVAKNRKIVVDKNFKILKRRIIEEPILALPDFKKCFQVETDASGAAVREILC